MATSPIRGAQNAFGGIVTVGVALRARTSGHADRPRFNTSWRGGREDRMAAATAELVEDAIKARACERPG